MSFIASGLAIAGMVGVEGAMGAAATVAASEALGAGIGALTNPKDPLKGALIGGATGAVGGGIGAGLGALGGAASGAADVAAAGASQVPTQAAIDTTANLATKAATPTMGQLFADLAPATTSSTTSSVAPVAETGGLFSGSMGSTLAKQAAPEVLKTGVGMATAPSYDDSGQKKVEENKATAQGWGSFAEGGLATIRAKHGGSVHLRNGDYIVPADVVSALGNGSTKAGAKYLTHLFNSLSAGPPPKAGSLAKRRTQERHAV